MAKIDLSGIDLSRLKSEHLIVICVLLTIAIIFFSYQSIFKPLVGEIKETSRQIEQRERDLQRAKTAQNLEDMEKEIKAIKEELMVYQQRLNAPIDIPQVLEVLDSIAKHQKIEFISVTPLEAKEVLLPRGEEFLLEVPIEMQLRCGYHALGVFINQIENADRVKKVTDLRMKVDSSNIWSHQVELVVVSYRVVSREEPVSR